MGKGLIRYLPLYLTLLWTTSSCKQREISKIEIIKLDTGGVNSIIRTSDRPKIDTSAKGEFYYWETYTDRKDGTVSKIAKDSIGDIVALVQKKKGVHFYEEEYFPNGQSKGKLKLDINGHPIGTATYYYENGRIKEVGAWNGIREVGLWKSYDSSGKLKSEVIYDDAGSMISKKVYD